MTFIKIRVERNKKAEPVSPGSSNMVRSALSRRFNSLTVTVIVVVLIIVNQNYCHLLSEIDIDRLQISQQDLRILEILALR